MIVVLDLAPGSVVSEEELCERTGIGRTPIREALQRLERDQLVRVIARRGVMVAAIDLGDLALLYETRSILEPYVHRLAAARGEAHHWKVMEAALAKAEGRGSRASWGELLTADRVCHEQVWHASQNRFLLATLDALYAQSERLWHHFVRDTADLRAGLAGHRRILTALRERDGDLAASLIEEHVREFEQQTREVLTGHLRSPLAANG